MRPVRATRVGAHLTLQVRAASSLPGSGDAPKELLLKFCGWLACLADSGSSPLEGDEVARHLRHRAARPFVTRRGASVRKTWERHREFEDGARYE
jgi:hypothetical protein